MLPGKNYHWGDLVSIHLLGVKDLPSFAATAIATSHFFAEEESDYEDEVEERGGYDDEGELPGGYAGLEGYEIPLCLYMLIKITVLTKCPEHHVTLDGLLGALGTLEV